jgi:hypothetical protein
MKLSRWVTVPQHAASVKSIFESQVGSNLRYVAALLAVLGMLVPAASSAAKWVANPSQAGQWIDLESRRPADPTDPDVLRFDVSLAVDPDSGQPSTAEDDLVIEVVSCISGKRLMLMPMLDNQTRHLPTLPQGDPLLKLICG